MGRSLVELLGNVNDNGIVNDTLLAVNVVSKWRVRSDVDVFLVAEFQKLGLEETRVQLDLVSSRSDAAVVQNVLKLGDVKVGDTC